MSYLSMNTICMKPPNRFLTEPKVSTPLTTTATTTTTTMDNNNLTVNGRDKTIQEVWSKYKFEPPPQGPTTPDYGEVKMSWATINADEMKINNEHSVKEKCEDEMADDEEDEKIDVTVKQQDVEEKETSPSPSHHARRPMNAFLIFCKKHRPIVRERYPNLENRGVTRILGEWWALLDDEDKAPFTGLAKAYKDAFLSANPDFKWYKLPAPPLRSAQCRPITTTPILTATVARPHNHHHQITPISSPTHESEFTPGKLADESQLGSLTSLLNNNNNNNNNFTASKLNIISKHGNNNNNNETNNNMDDARYENCPDSPVNLIMKTQLPPAPIKKRITQKYVDNKIVARNLLDTARNDDEYMNNMPNNNGTAPITNQDLLNKVVDDIFTRQTDDHCGLDSKINKEIRKSGRQCKGKRYEQFMVEGKLLGNKRDTKLTSQQRLTDDKLENEILVKLDLKQEIEPPNLDLTIKRLAERTNMRNLLESSEKAPEINELKSQNTNFDLELRIKNLPSLSYDVFCERKRESKKRKSRVRNGGDNDNGGPKHKMAKVVKEAQPALVVVGSKKRKNKQSITHLEQKDDIRNEINNDLLGLATLAEVAANTQKINERADDNSQ